MHITSFCDLPQEVIPLILYHTDIKGIRGLLSLDKKKTLKIQEIASKYLNELKEFYIPLIHLQQQYSSKIHIIYAPMNYDKEIMTNKVITGKILKTTNRFILAPALTDEDKIYMDLSIKTFTNQCNKSRFEDEDAEPITKFAEDKNAEFILKLAKDREPKDIILKPALQEEFTTLMIDNSENAKQSSYYLGKSNKVAVTIFPITKFSLNFDPSCTLPEETKQKIVQSLDLANTFYQEISKKENRSKLESTLDVNTLKERA